MSSTYGVTATGFAAKPLDACRSELEQLVRATFGEGTNLEPEGPWGQLVGILAEREAELWDMAQEVYVSRDPDQAQGSALDALCAITGTVREPARRSTVACDLSGTAGTVIEAGVAASVEGGGARFVSVERVVLDATGNALGVAFEAEQPGPVIAPARMLTVIETPIGGWSAISNPADAIIGADVESDVALRLRRKDELTIAASATLDAIRSEVLHVGGVTACTVFENATSVAVGGMPPSSVEVLVSGGADVDIGQAIWRSRSAGIETYGTSSVSIVDSQGVTRTLEFSRPTTVNLWAKITLKKDPLRYPANGDDLVKQAVAAQAQAQLAAGVDFVTRSYLPAVLSISGVRDVPYFQVAKAAPPPAAPPTFTSEANVVVASREQAVLMTTCVIVAASDFVDA
jgi:uncharacterized phage protein gp47/JayE